MRIKLQIRREVPEQGFPALLFVEHNRQSETISGYLPVLPPDLQTLAEQWRHGYLGLEEVGLRLTPRPMVDRVSLEQLRDRESRLKRGINDWLDSGGRNWQSIRDHLTICANRSRELRQPVELFLEVEDDRLMRLPWQEWQFLDEKFPKSELVFSSRRDHTLQAPQSATAVRILVVVGDTAGIEQGIQKDIEAIQNLADRGAMVEILEQPDRRTLLDHLWEKTYDIFVFTGHSGSDERGRIGWIDLSSRDRISIDNLTEALGETVEKGLQICIFNSCDGLGLANHLARLRLPVTIVMREPVPDDVAARFLRIFLEEFATGRALFSAFWKARQRVKGEFNSDYPGVRWLPKIFMGKPATPPNWRQLGGKKNRPWRIPRRRMAIALGLLLGATGAGLLAYALSRIAIELPKQPAEPIYIQTSDGKTVGVETVVSRGERELLRKPLVGDYKTWKAEGIKAFKAGNWKQAKQQFTNLRKKAKAQHGRDPEAKRALQDFEVLIYLNNTEAILKSNETNVSVRTIAAVSPINLEVGSYIFYGIAQAQQQAIANGNPLVIVLADDGNTVEQSAKVAEFLARDQSILAIVGHYTTANTCAALGHYSNNFMPVVSPASSVVNIRGSDQSISPGCGDRRDPNEVFFRTTSTADQEAKALHSHLVQSKLGVRSVALFYRKGEPYSENLRSSFKQTDDGQSKIQEINLGSEAEVKAFLSSQPDSNLVIAMFADGRTLDQQSPNDEPFHRAVRIVEKTKGNNLILGANTLLLADVLSGLVELQENKTSILNQLTVAVDWIEDSGQADIDFVKAASEEWGGSVNQRTAISFEAVQVLAKAVMASDSKQGIQKRKAVLDVIRGIDIKSLVFKNASIRFSNDGNRIGLPPNLLLIRATVDNNGNRKFERVPER
jgi:branched-chain amino acid transport system substrate-binding protein